MKKIINTAILIFFTHLAQGQQAVITKPDSLQSNKVVIVAGLQYISNITYAGRRDASSVPIGIPTLTIASKNGLFLSTAGYLNLDKGSFSADGLSFTPGYIFSIDAANKLRLSLSATKYFFKNSSSIILNAFKGSADVVLSYQPKFAKFSLNNSYQFGKQTNDIVNAIEVTKEISLAKFGKSKLTIDPLLSFYAGTQSFTETYYTESVYPRSTLVPGTNGGLGGLFPGQPGYQQITQETVTEEKQREVKKYQALSLIATLPVTLSVSKFQFSLTPYLIMPYNEVSYNANTKTGNYFLFTAGMIYIF